MNDKELKQKIKNKLRKILVKRGEDIPKFPIVPAPIFDYTVFNEILEEIKKEKPDKNREIFEEIKNWFKVFSRIPIGGRGYSSVKIKKVNGTEINPATEAKQDDIIAELRQLTGFQIPEYDYIALTYVATGNGAGEIETVVFKTGGASGTTVATLTLAYNASNEISSVTKT